MIQQLPERGSKSATLAKNTLINFSKYSSTLIPEDLFSCQIEWVKIECEDAKTFLDWTVDGVTSYGSCLRIQLASRPGMSFQVFIITMWMG